MLPDSTPDSEHPRPVVLADFDVDGDTDVVASELFGRKGVALFRNDGRGTLSGPTYLTPHAKRERYLDTTGAFAVADVDLDGAPDLVLTYPYRREIAVFCGDHEGGVSAPTFFGSGGAQPRGLAVADVTGDGALDLIVENGPSYEIAVLAGNGRGAFAPPGRFDADSAAVRRLLVADVNGDGAADVVTAGWSGLTVYPNRP